MLIFSVTNKPRFCIHRKCGCKSRGIGKKASCFLHENDAHFLENPFKSACSKKIHSSLKGLCQKAGALIGLLNHYFFSKRDIPQCSKKWKNSAITNLFVPQLANSTESIFEEFFNQIQLQISRALCYYILKLRIYIYCMQ